jgi:hypothetical protein
MAADFARHGRVYVGCVFHVLILGLETFHGDRKHTTNTHLSTIRVLDFFLLLIAILVMLLVFELRNRSTALHLKDF